MGLAPAIRKLADERMRVRLAVSLHTPDDELPDTRDLPDLTAMRALVRRTQPVRRYLPSPGADWAAADALLHEPRESRE